MAFYTHRTAGRWTVGPAVARLILCEPEVKARAGYTPAPTKKQCHINEMQSSYTVFYSLQHTERMHAHHWLMRVRSQRPRSVTRSHPNAIGGMTWQPMHGRRVSHLPFRPIYGTPHINKAAYNRKVKQTQTMSMKCTIVPSSGSFQANRPPFHAHLSSGQCIPPCLISTPGKKALGSLPQQPRCALLWTSVVEWLSRNSMSPLVCATHTSATALQKSDPCLGQGLVLNQGFSLPLQVQVRGTLGVASALKRIRLAAGTHSRLFDDTIPPT